MSLKQVAMKPRMSPTQIRYGFFESMPAIFHAYEAWVLFGNDWCQINSGEVTFGAGLMTEEKFKKSYGALPALPENAFGASP